MVKGLIVELEYSEINLPQDTLPTTNRKWTDPDWHPTLCSEGLAPDSLSHGMTQEAQFHATSS